MARPSGGGIEWAQRKRSSAGNSSRNEEIGISGRQSRVHFFMLTISVYFVLVD